MASSMMRGLLCGVTDWRCSLIRTARHGEALDIWVTTRARTSYPWSDPVNVTSLNSGSLDARPSLKYDGTTISFHSGRPGVLGSNDIHVSTRTRLDDDGHDDGDDEEDEE